MVELILRRRRANPVYLDPCTSRYITISTGLTRLVNILIQRIFNIYCSQARPALHHTAALTAPATAWPSWISNTVSGAVREPKQGIREKLKNNPYQS